MTKPLPYQVDEDTIPQSRVQGQVSVAVYNQANEWDNHVWEATYWHVCIKIRTMMEDRDG